MIFQFQPGHTWYHRLDPVSKFVWLACVSVLCLAFETAAAQGVLLLSVVLLGRCAAGLTLRAQWRGIRLPFYFGIPYFFLQLLFLPGETSLLAIGSVILTVEALDYAAAVSLRLLTLVLASLLFIATTDPRDVVLALAQQLRIPYRFAFAVSIALRFLPILEAEASLVRSAQRLRGLPADQSGGFRDRIKMGFANERRFAFSIFAGAVRRVQRMAEAMEGRAFGLYRGRTYLRQLRISRSGAALSFGSIIFTSLALILYFLSPEV